MSSGKAKKSGLPPARVEARVAGRVAMSGTEKKGLDGRAARHLPFARESKGQAGSSGGETDIGLLGPVFFLYGQNS